MRKNHRFAFLAIGGLGLLAAVAPGLAATLTVPTSANVPAAGQGVVTVQGFTVTDIQWTVDNDTEKITVVRFNIRRTASNAPVVDAADDEDSGNAVVRVRLEKGATVMAWKSCSTSGGDQLNDTPAAAVCVLAANQSPAASADGEMLAADLEQVNIIAFDRN